MPNSEKTAKELLDRARLTAVGIAHEFEKDPTATDGHLFVPQRVLDALEMAFLRTRGIMGSVDDLARLDRDNFRLWCLEVGMVLGRAKTPQEFYALLRRCMAEKIQAGQQTLKKG